MNYTDRFFEFPIRIYDSFSIIKARQQEEESDCPVEPDWVEGWACIPAEDITGFHDLFSKDRTLDEVAQKGCNLTIVNTKSNGEFVCNMRRSKFKALLNTHTNNLFLSELNLPVKEEVSAVSGMRVI